MNRSWPGEERAKGFLGRDILLKVEKGGQGLIEAGPRMPGWELQFSPEGSKEP